MKFFNYSPETSSDDYGKRTVYSDAERIDVIKLHFEFSSWPLDDLQCCDCCFIGTERLKKALEAVVPPLTGIEFCAVEVSGDHQEFDRVHRKGRPDSALGVWHWFKVTGRPGVHDFGQNYRSLDLIVSERVVEVLKHFTIINPKRKITEYHPPRTELSAIELGP